LGVTPNTLVTVGAVVSIVTFRPEFLTVF